MLGEFKVEQMQKVQISPWPKPQINTMECGPPIKKVFKNNKPWLIIGPNLHLWPQLPKSNLMNLSENIKIRQGRIAMKNCRKKMKIHQKAIGNCLIKRRQMSRLKILQLYSKWPRMIIPRKRKLQKLYNWIWLVLKNLKNHNYPIETL